MSPRARVQAIDSERSTAWRGRSDTARGRDLRLDVPAERELDRWLEETARRGPLSLLTEDAGWRHFGPGKRGKPVPLADFDHGGPRICVDPIDGTRVLMTDLRSAWSVIALAGAGAGPPRLSEVAVGVLSEIPYSRAASFQRFSAARGALPPASTPCATPSYRAQADHSRDDRADHGFFPFFRYAADRARRSRRRGRVLPRDSPRRTRRCGLATTTSTSNGGQLTRCSRSGGYRMIADLRAWQAAARARGLTSKPYDVAGRSWPRRKPARVVEAADGSAELGFRSAAAPVSFVGWVNAATRKRLRKHRPRR